MDYIAEYLIKMVVLVALAIAGAFTGKKLRERKDANSPAAVSDKK